MVLGEFSEAPPRSRIPQPRPPSFLEKLAAKFRPAQAEPAEPAVPAPYTLPATVVASTDDGLVVEFDAPEGGFEVPGGALDVCLARRPMLVARIDPAASTRPGPVAAGLTVRLVLHVVDPDRHWPFFRRDLRYVGLAWAGPAGRVILDFRPA